MATGRPSRGGALLSFLRWAPERQGTAHQVTVANTSQHLQQLLRAGLVRTRRDGNRVYHAIADDRVAQPGAMLRSVAAEHLAEVEHLGTAYLGDCGKRA